MSAETAVIANVTENTWTLHRTYGTFFINGIATLSSDAPSSTGTLAGVPFSASAQSAQPSAFAKAAADKGMDVPQNTRVSPSGAGILACASAPDAAHTRPCAVTVVTPRTSIMDLGDKRTMELRVSAREIADDLCREINGDAGEDSFLGAFVCAGDEPTCEEIAAAAERLDAFYRRKVAEADREWARSHSHLFLDDLQRRAARTLGLEREWNYELRESQECPGCGERLKPNVAVCKSCGAILNREKAAQLGLIAATQAASESAHATRNREAR